MGNYITSANGEFEHYSFVPYEGISVRKLNGITWQRFTPILPDSTNIFCVYTDESGVAHMIYTDKANNLMYASRKSGVWRAYTLCSVNRSIQILKICLYPVGNRLNTIYSAQSDNELILVHCILGNHAKPATVSRLKAPDFCISGNKVYYTNANGVLGSTSLSDEKPEGFTSVAEGGKEPCAYENHLVYTKDSCIYFDDVQIAQDPKAIAPVLFSEGDKWHIMWQSGCFIRYVVSFNKGKTWSEPMRYVNNQIEPQLYFFQTGNQYISHYGYHTDNNLKILGVSDPFTPQPDMEISVPGEIEQLKTLLTAMHNEVQSLKHQISEIVGNSKD